MNPPISIRNGKLTIVCLTTILLHASFKSRQHYLKKKKTHKIVLSIQKKTIPELGLFRDMEWCYKCALPLFFYGKDYEKMFLFNLS